MKKIPCEICGAPGTHWKRCDEHYRCDDCGTTENICFWGKKYGLLCDPCQKKQADKRVQDFDGSTEYEDCIICPWCGNEVTDDLYEYEDGSVEDCNYCNRTYTVGLHETIQYSTRRQDT